MLTAPQAKVLLKNHKNDLMPVIVGCQTHFEITIGGQSIAAQRNGLVMVITCDGMPEHQTLVDTLVTTHTVLFDCRREYVSLHK